MFMKSIFSFNDATFLQSDIDPYDILAWHIKSWKLFVNPSKCDTMQLALSPKDPPSYSIIDISLESVEECRDLCVVVSSIISHGDHYKYMRSKTYNSLKFNLLVGQSLFLLQLLLRRLYIYVSLVRSRLCYCSQLWRPHLVSDVLYSERVRTLSYKIFPCGLYIYIY